MMLAPVPTGGLVIFVAIAVLMITALYLRRRHGAKKVAYSKLPPGYTGWPLLGELLPFLKPCLSTTLGDFMEQRMARFGKIFSTNLGGHLVVVSADPELTRFVLQNEMRLFEHDWPQASQEVMGKTSMGFHEGDVHRQLRSTFLSFFSTARLRTSTLSDADQLATALLSTWRDGLVVSAVDATEQFTFNMIVRSALGMEAGEPETEKLRKHNERVTIGPFLIPLNVPGTRYHKALQARNNIRKVIKKAMMERMNLEGNTTTDFLGWLMKNTTLSEEQISDLLQGVVFAGTKTTSKLICLVIYFLEGCPKAHEQLREEHIQIVRSKNGDGQSKLTWDDYKQMEFTQCVINETLRLGNIGRHLMKKASTDIQFKGFVIPRGCKIVTSFLAAHLDPSAYENPEKFNPWRWLSISCTTKSNNFMPFGGGPRLCAGMEMAKLETAVILHHLILNYTWKLVEDDHPISTPEVIFPKGLPIKVDSVEMYNGYPVLLEEMIHLHLTDKER